MEQYRLSMYGTRLVETRSICMSLVEPSVCTSATVELIRYPTSVFIRRVPGRLNESRKEVKVPPTVLACNVRVAAWIRLLLRVEARKAIRMNELEARIGVCTCDRHV